MPFSRIERLQPTKSPTNKMEVSHGHVFSSMQRVWGDGLIHGTCEMVSPVSSLFVGSSNLYFVANLFCS